MRALTVASAEASGLPRPKLVFLDLDGTVVDGSHEVHPRTIEAVRKVAARGVPVCVATGRPYFAAEGIARMLGATGVGMFFSGALLIDPETDTARVTHRLSWEQVLRTLAVVRDLGCHAELYTRNEYVIEEPNELTTVIHRSYLPLDPEIAPFETLEGAEILKVGLVLDRSKSDEVLRAVRAGLPELTVSQAAGAAHPEIMFANITSPSALRDHAFSYITGHYGVRAAEVAAFGDSESDMVFLEKAGWGCAMGNAPGHVRAAARFTIDSVDAEGVAKALALLFP